MDTDNNTQDNTKDSRKLWIEPEIKEVMSVLKGTEGGNFSSNSPGDDAWYSS
tara:strand:- start:164 stop:319 length:156 start_codon:yes stop_codon:yes gene_type:complete